MKIKNINWVIFLAIFACNTEKNQDTNSKQVHIDENFTIELPANHTTGYRWQLENMKSINTIDSIGYSYTVADSIVQGADGVEIWNFKAVKKGVDTLKFVYAK